MIRRDNIAARGIILALLVAGAFTMMVPFLWSLSTSLKTDDTVYSRPTELIPRDDKGQVSLHWENYLEVWKAIPLHSYYMVSIIAAVATTIGRVTTSSLAAYAFARLKFPGRDKLFLLYLATMMIPGEVTMIPIFVLISKMHWMNTYWALILPGMFTAFGTFMLRQFFMTLPSGLEDAARVDGCSRLGIWWRVIIPLSVPALVTLTIFTFLGSWNDFMWPLIVTHTKDMFTIPVGLAQMQSDYQQNLTLLMAASIQVLVPVFILFFACQKRITEGIVMSGFGKF